jgi:hypothetical protein
MIRITANKPLFPAPFSRYTRVKVLTPKQILFSDFYLNDYFFDKIIIFILYKL